MNDANAWMNFPRQKCVRWLDICCCKCMEVSNLSVITCFQCGLAKEEEMSVDACQFFYKCAHCGTLLKPKSGDCCVYCSYGSVKCLRGRKIVVLLNYNYKN